MEIYYAAGGITRYSVNLYPDGGAHIYFYIETDLQKFDMRSCSVPAGTSPVGWAKRHYEHFGGVVKPYWQGRRDDEDTRMRQFLLEYCGQSTFDLEAYS